MKITFIRPNMTATRASDAMQPLVFAILASLTPPDVELAFYDERLEDLDLEHDTDLVAITVETYTARRSYEIASHFRARGIPVVMGGYHPTFMPNEALQYADSVVVGDAEELWQQVVHDARHKQLKPIYQHPDMLQVTEFSYDRSIFEGKKYSRLVPVQYGRGCRFACDFCSIHAFYGPNLRQRGIEDLAREVESLDSKFVMFVDDNLFIDDPTTEAFLHGIKDLNIRWACQISVDVTYNPKLLDLMAESGCMVTQIGLESLNENNLKQMKKKWAVKQQDYVTSLRQIRERGMMIYGTFVLGYDEDTPDTFKRTVDFALENKFCLANFNPLTPMPGTKLYDRLITEKRLRYGQWWLDSNYTYGEAAYTPRGMTAEELTDGCYWARTEFNTYSNIFKRAFDLQANAHSVSNLGVYLAANLVSRKEIHSKQGSTLGSPQSSITAEALL